MRYMVVGSIAYATKVFMSLQTNDLEQARQWQRDMAMIYNCIQIGIVDRLECSIIL